MVTGNAVLIQDDCHHHAYLKRNRDAAIGLIAAIETTIDTTKFSTEGSQNYEKLKAIYLFLDVLDRKANSLITLNSILLGVVTLFAIRPMLDALITGKSSPVLGWAQVALTGITILAALAAIVASLIIYRVKWPYAWHVALAPAGGTSLGWQQEIRCLARECVSRTWWLSKIWLVTIFSILFTAVTAVAIFVSVASTPAELEAHGQQTTMR